MSVGSGVARMVESSSTSAIVGCGGGNKVGARRQPKVLHKNSHPSTSVNLNIVLAKT